MLKNNNTNNSNDKNNTDNVDVTISDNKEKIKDIKEDETTALIPAIIQDVTSKEILMLAFMNKQSFIKSLLTGYTWFYSRERNCIWNKGETSGNFQKIVRLFTDCDNDALVLQVVQEGAACHTGNRSCFFNEIKEVNNIEKKELSSFADMLSFGNYSGIYDRQPDKEASSLKFLEDLYKIISGRIELESEESYTYRLHKKGMEEILKKVGEESIEVILASAAQKKEQIIYEIADLLYHLIVLMVEKKINFNEIMTELRSRHK